MTQVHTNYPTHNGTVKVFGAILSHTHTLSLSNKKQNLTRFHLFIHFSRNRSSLQCSSSFPVVGQKESHHRGHVHPSVHLGPVAALVPGAHEVGHGSSRPRIRPAARGTVHSPGDDTALLPVAVRATAAAIGVSRSCRNCRRASTLPGTTTILASSCYLTIKIATKTN